MALSMWLGRHVAPPRFLLFIAVALGGATMLMTMTSLKWQMSLLYAFDVASALFLLSLIPLLRERTADEMRRTARANDANRALILIITALVGLSVMAAVWLEISGSKDKASASPLLIVGSLALSWLFSNMVYALHYAHLYYSDHCGRDRRGLDFPADDGQAAESDNDANCPNYWDFIYFSFTLGMTFQTSDTGITNTPMRQVVTLQSLAAFIFNIGVIAFTINVLGGSSG